MMDIDEKIAQETQNIETLEASYPESFPQFGRYHEKNRPFEVHHTKVRDAYWRRRMLTARKENLDLDATAKIY